jgi:hypothetical protein
MEVVITGIREGHTHNNMIQQASITFNSLLTQSSYNDWFLPSQNELADMYTNLYLYSVGNFSTSIYHSSTENGSNGCTVWNFSGAGGTYETKGTSERVRACRSFISSTIYALRSYGQAGGLISSIVNNGNGTYTYYEAATNDQSSGYVWSNVTSTLIGTTGGGIGTGATNTAAIIAQAGHTTSAALICKNLIV